MDNYTFSERSMHELNDKTSWTKVEVTTNENTAGVTWFLKSWALPICRAMLRGSTHYCTCYRATRGAIGPHCGFSGSPRMKTAPEGFYNFRHQWWYFPWYMRVSEYCQKLKHMSTKLCLLTWRFQQSLISILNAYFYQFKFFLPLWRD